MGIPLAWATGTAGSRAEQGKWTCSVDTLHLAQGGVAQMHELSALAAVCVARLAMMCSKYLNASAIEDVGCTASAGMVWGIRSHT
jgi:hypothetical protein